MTVVMIVVWCLGCASADEKSTPVQCESVENVIERIECYASLAEDTNDPSVCGQSPDEGVGYQCYAIVAERLANVELCDMIPTQTPDHQQLKDACISDVAKKTLEPLLCDRVETVGLRDSCYAAIGQKTANTAVCDKIHDPGLRSICSGEPVMVDTTQREPSAPKLGLGEEEADALEAFNPQFKARTTEDYSSTIQADALNNDRQPFMLRLDANHDGTADVVLDGHDDQHNILLCLLSSPGGYDVLVIRESSLLVPDEVKSWNDGVKESGLNYYLWPNQEGAGFTLAFPQQSDSEGNLLNDGFMIDYTFSDGAFTEKSQVL
jgi:hypothetical protein